MHVKHFRLETDDRSYLIALIPIHFAPLASPSSAAGTPPDALYMLVLDGDAFIEPDPYSWKTIDWDLVYAHFYLREHADEHRDHSVLRASEIRAKVHPTVLRLLNDRASAPHPPPTPAAATTPGPQEPAP